MRYLLVACSAVFCLMVPPLAAQTTPPLRSADALYMGQGLVLTASAPRQLTLNAHVQQFLYQPGGDSIAYVSVQDDADHQTTSVKFVDARQKDPDTQTIFSITGDAPETPAPVPQADSVHLLGWSEDGRWLLIHEDSNHPGNGRFLLGDVGASPLTARPIPLPDPPAGTQVENLIAVVAWSPSGRRVLVVRQGTLAASAEIYDPNDGATQAFTLGDNQHVQDVIGWLDEDHLLLQRFGNAGEKRAYVRYDLGSGKETQIARPSPWPLPTGALLSLSPPAPSPTTPKVPGLTLEVQAEKIADAQRVAATDAHSVWIHRAKAPPAISALAVGVTPGADDPQAQWSPDGNTVAFLAHGDLFASRLSERDATPREKLAAGEPLSCVEEQMLAASNLKQIGLGILQYVQDNDENFPAMGTVADKIMPYLQDPSLFTLGSSRFVYHAPADPALAHMDSPADTVLGTMDLPCAEVTLFADGHVRTRRKTGGDATR